MNSDDPLYFTLVLNPIAEPRPSDAADVLVSLDDFARFGALVRSADGAGAPPPIPGWSSEFSWDLLLQLGTDPAARLTAKRIEFGSPLEIVSEIPWELVGTGGGLWAFVSGIERLWNLPKRVRVESKRLDADEQEEARRYWEERLAAEEAEASYREYRAELTQRRLQGPRQRSPRGFRGRSGLLTDRLPEPRRQRPAE